MLGRKKVHLVLWGVFTLLATILAWVIASPSPPPTTRHSDGLRANGKKNAPKISPLPSPLDALPRIQPPPARAPFPAAKEQPKSILEQFTVTIQVDGGQGMVAPLHQSVSAGSRALISFIPAPGYRIESLRDNGRIVKTLSPYIIESIQEHHRLSVAFFNHPPQVKLLEPSRGVQVLGRVTVRAQITDDSGLAGAELIVNGITLQRQKQPTPLKEETRIPGFIQTEDFTFAASPGALQLSEEGTLRQHTDEDHSIPLLSPDSEMRDLQVFPERGWLLLTFGHDQSDSYGQRSPVLLLDPARSLATGLLAFGYEILPSIEYGSEPFSLNEDGSLGFAVRDTLTGSLSRAHWSAVHGWRYTPFSLVEEPMPLPRSQIAWLEFGPEIPSPDEPGPGQIWTFSFDSTAQESGVLDIVVRAWDHAQAFGDAFVTVNLTPVKLSLYGERRTVTVGPQSRQYAQLYLSASAYRGHFTQLRMMRSTGDGDFVPQVSYPAEQFAPGPVAYADKYLSPERVYRYRLEALDATGRVMGRSEVLKL